METDTIQNKPTWENQPWAKFISDVRLCRRLRIKGIKTLGEVALITREEWEATRGLGKKSINKLNETLVEITGKCMPCQTKEAEADKLPPGEKWEALGWNLFIKDKRTIEGIKAMTGETRVVSLKELIKIPSERWLSLNNFGKKAARLIFTSTWAGALYTHECDESHPDLPWELKPWCYIHGIDQLPPELLKRVHGKCLGEIASDKVFTNRPEGATLLEKNGAYPITTKVMPSQTHICSPNLFETNSPENAWAVCFRVAGVNEKEQQALLREGSLKDAGEKLGDITRERTRQLYVSASKKLNRNPITAAAIQRYFETNEEKWAKLIEDKPRSEWGQLLDPWARAAIRCQRKRIFTWAETQFPERFEQATSEERHAEYAKILKCVEDSKELSLPIEEISKRMGMTRTRIQKIVPGQIKNYVTLYSNGPLIDKALGVTDKWKTDLIVPRSEILKEFPDLDTISLNHTLRNGVAWGAGPFIIIPPRQFASVTPVEIEVNQDFKNEELKLIAALNERPFWRSQDAVQKIIEVSGGRWIYWLNQNTQVKTLAPGYSTVRETLTPTEQAELENTLLESRSLTAYILAKETEGKLCNYPMWTPRMEMLWAEWLLTQTSQLARVSATRLAKVAQPEWWEPSKRAENIAEKLNVFLEKPYSKKFDKKFTPIAEEDMASIAALILKTGGLSMWDLGIILSRCIRQPNPTLLKPIQKRGWVIPQRGYGWQPINPSPLARKSMLNTIRQESALKWEAFQNIRS
jgi:hypothetical protein